MGCLGGSLEVLVLSKLPHHPYIPQERLWHRILYVCGSLQSSSQGGSLALEGNWYSKCHGNIAAAHRIQARKNASELLDVLHCICSVVWTSLRCLSLSLQDRLNCLTELYVRVVNDRLANKPIAIANIYDALMGVPDWQVRVSDFIYLRGHPTH